MKTIVRIAVSIVLTYALLTLTNCATDNSRNNTAEINDRFEDERSEIAQDLRELREDISEELQRIGDKMEDAGEEAREELSGRNEELLERRERVDIELERVETSSQENWEDIKQGARNTFQDVKREVNELADRISE